MPAARPPGGLWFLCGLVSAAGLRLPQMCRLAPCVTAPEAFLLLRLCLGIATGMSREGAEEQCDQVQAEVLGRDWHAKQ